MITLTTELLDAHAAVIVLVGAAQGSSDASTGLNQAGGSEPGVGMFCSEVFTSGQLVVVTDVDQDPRWAGTQRAETLAIRSCIGMPMRIDRDSIAGCFCVVDRRPREWSPQQLGIVEALAAVATSEVALILSAQEAVQGLTEAEHARAEIERAHRRLEFLAESSALLAASLDYETTLRTVTQLTLPMLADWCAIHLRNDDDSVTRIALASANEGDEKLFNDLTPHYSPDAPVGPARVVRTGTTEVIPVITDDYLRGLARDPEHLTALRAAGWNSLVVAPLTVRGWTFGSLACALTAAGSRYSPDDIKTIEQLAGRVAAAVDNARVYRERDIVARTLQRSLLPPSLPDVHGLALATYYRPAQASRLVGGDFYDLFQIGRDEWFAAIGDVCGKGIQAAALTGLARHAIRTAAMRADSPGEVLAVLNDALPQDDVASQDTRLCTAICLRLAPRTCSGGQPADAFAGRGSRPSHGVDICLASGGHPHPLVLRTGGQVEWVACEGMVLGAFTGQSYADSKVALEAGDTLVLYTDGVTEARRAGSLFGARHLADILSACRGLGANEIAAELGRAVAEWEADDIRDDLALLVIQATGR